MTELEPAELDLASLLKARIGLQISERVRDAEQVFDRLARACGETDIRDLVRHMNAADPRFQKLIDEVTVRETYFFRHPEHFSSLRAALPELRARGGNAGRLRLWSAGCASGEEAYSVAMMLDREGLLGEAAVFGSDLCASALTAARRGRYREWSLRALSPELTAQYFTREGTEFVLSHGLRQQVAFFPLNLAEPSYPSVESGAFGFDVILCRNVLIYFDGDVIQDIVGRLFNALTPGGWLFTSPSDPVLAGFAPFETITTDHGLLYRKPLARAPCVRASAALAPEPHARQATTRRDDARAGSELPAERAGRAAISVGSPIAFETAPGAEQAAAATAVRAAFKTLGPLPGGRACDAALSRHPLCPELHYLRALSLLEAGCLRDAERALKRCLYLDRSLTLAHFALGVLRTRMGDENGARQAFQNALAGCRDRPRLEPLPLGEGLTVSEVAHATKHALVKLQESLR